MYGYCVAIGNEAGGWLILGVENDINPTTGMRNIVGTQATPNIEEAKSQIYRALGTRIDIFEIHTTEGRVVMIKVPHHPIGQIFRFYGVPLMRVGEELLEMDNQRLKDILNEGANDFTAHIREGVTIKDLDPRAITEIKKRWAEKQGHPEYLQYSDEVALHKLQLLRDGKCTNAAILLLGSEETLAFTIANAEFFFEWRTNPHNPEFEFRRTIRYAFILMYKEIWDLINARNTRVSIQKDFYEGDIWAYEQVAVDEAVLNAFGHREYVNRTEPTYLRLSPEGLTIKSAGGFLPGVTPENAIHAEGRWRNPHLMGVLATIGLVERAGIGLDRIYTSTIMRGKGLPMFQADDQTYVILHIPAQVKDPQFIKYIEKISHERDIEFTDINEILFLEKVRTENKADNEKLRTKFLELGIIEKSGRSKYLLAKEFYAFSNNLAEYTRQRWFSKDTEKMLILNHIQHQGAAKFSDFIGPQGLFKGNISKSKVKKLLEHLKKDQKIYFDGPRRSQKN